MNPDELRKMEEQLLNSPIPEDESDARDTVATNISRKVKNQAKENPKSFILKILIGLGCVIILILVISIINLLNSGENTQEEQVSTIEGFDYLKETQTEKTADVSQQLTENTVTENATDTTEMASTMASNKYFLSPSMKSALVTDSLFQLGEKVYKLPVSMRELEESGIALVTLGSQPPAEDAYLSAGLRDGYIQFGSERYQVSLKNGTDCTYHDLTVVSIQAETDPGCSFYAFGGLTMGSEEASIPQGADRIETDAPFNTHTFYYFGELTGGYNEKSGRQTVVVTDNSTGKIVRITIFNDATVTGGNNDK